MCTHLAKRGATYYFRRVIPVELRPAFDGKSEFMLSLRTKDRGEAKRQIPARTIATDKLLSDARACLRPAPEAAPVNPWKGMTQEDFERWLQHQSEETRLTSAEDDRMEAAAEWVARLPADHYAALALRDMRAQLDGYRDRYKVRKHRDTNRETREPTLWLSPGIAPPVTPDGTLLTAEDGIADVVDLWAAERKVQPKGIDTHRAVARWFYERTGIKPVHQITRKDVLDFKSKLLEEGQTPANIKMKLSRLRTLLQWAFLNDHAPLNAAQGVEIRDTEAAKNKRRPFDLASMNAIFASPVYATGERPTAGAGEAAYWLPLLALFTGARLEELGQLRPDDLQSLTYPNAGGEERSGWFLHLIAVEDGQRGGIGTKLKNAGSERLVPVHPELERLGFVTYATLMKAQGMPRLFHLLKPNIYSIITAKWGEWWSLYRRNICGVTDRRMVFHSFRHTFKDYARHAGISEGVQRQIMGHSGDDVADNYGSGHSLYRVTEAIKLYQIPGLRLPKPMAQSAGEST